MRVPLLDLHWQHEQIKEPLKKRWDNILDQTSFIMGPDVSEFERDFASYIGTTNCLGVADGTAALYIAIKALNLPAASEIITLPTSFFASASAVIHAGHVPRFAEVDLVTGNYDYTKLAEAVNSKTRAIIAVHLYGRAVDMDQLLAFASAHNLIVIEDAAQAHGAKYKSKTVGSFGKVGCFSFYPGKNLGAYGDAGAIVTSDDSLVDKIKRLRAHGCLGKYDHELVGYNDRLDTLQAAVLAEKLKLLDRWNDLRKEIAQKYYTKFATLETVKVISPDDINCGSAHHLFAIRVANRDHFIEQLKELGVGASVHYPKALHTIPCLQLSGCQEGDFPNAETIARETVTLPLYTGMTSEQVDYVISAVEKICR